MLIPITPSGFAFFGIPFRGFRFRLCATARQATPAEFLSPVTGPIGFLIPHSTFHISHSVNYLCGDEASPQRIPSARRRRDIIPLARRQRYIPLRRRGADATSFLIPHSSFLIPHSSFLIPHYSMFMTCSRTFEISILSARASSAMQRSVVLEESVVISRFISCPRKSSSRPGSPSLASNWKYLVK